MRQTLRLHPDSVCTTITQVEVDVSRPRAGCLSLRYFVCGKMSDLSLPSVGAPVRADELWRHTCFEAFLRVSPSDAYSEFNFAPSRQWAVYSFDSYRSGMRVASEIGVPQIDVKANDDGCELIVSLELDNLANLPGDVPWDIGLSAVIEEKSGNKSYWALAHPPGKPDFHHADCFALQIPPDSRP